MTSTGWPAVRDRCAEFDVTFDAWQDGAGKLILAKRADGSYAASIGGVVMSIPRQVGKTFLIGAIVFALCLLNPGLTVLWTAHRLRTANETFSKMQAFTKRRKVKPHVAKIVLGSGDEEIQFHNGSRILFGARERGFGRGFDDVDVEVFDEAQILTENAVDDMIPAMNTAANPLPIYIGTPPKPSDPSEVFTAKRTEALSGTDEDTAYIEFSADAGCDTEDRAQWLKANPSYPGRTPDTAMLRMKKNLTADSFVREGLGIWDEAESHEVWGVVSKSQWSEALDRDAPAEGWLTGPVALSVEMSEDRATSSINAAGAVGDGIGVDVLVCHPGSTWVVDTLVELTSDPDKPVSHVVIDPRSQAGSLIGDLTAAGVTVTECKTQELAKATGWLIDAIRSGAVIHRGNPDLDRAASVARLRKYGESKVIDRWSAHDASPFIGVNLAVWGHQQPAEPEPYAVAVYA